MTFAQNASVIVHLHDEPSGETRDVRVSRPRLSVYPIRRLEITPRHEFLNRPRETDLIFFSDRPTLVSSNDRSILSVDERALPQVRPLRKHTQILVCFKVRSNRMCVRTDRDIAPLRNAVGESRSNITRDITPGPPPFRPAVTLKRDETTTSGSGGEKTRLASCRNRLRQVSGPYDWLGKRIRLRPIGRR